MRERVLGPDHPSLARHLEQTGTVLLAEGRYAEAKPLYERARNRGEVSGQRSIAGIR